MTTDPRDVAIDELNQLLKHFEVVPGNSLHSAINQAINRVASAPTPICIACGGRQTQDLASFRAHALLLRDEGATTVSVGPMCTTFGPKPQPPLTAEAVAQAIASKTPEPEGDDAYLP